MPIETVDAQAVRERAVDTGGADAEQATRDGAVWVGVVQSPSGWFRRRVDLTCPALGLPAAAREELEHRRRDLQMQGLCAEGAHNAAWEELNLDERYRTYLSSEETREALEDLRTLTERGPVVLASDRRPGFRCHRAVLASVLRRDGNGPESRKRDGTESREREEVGAGD